MYINPEKYAVMAQTLGFGNVRQYFLSKRSILKGEHCYPYMGDNIDEALFSDFIGNAVTVNNGNAARFMMHYPRQRYPEVDFTVMELD